MIRRVRGESSMRKRQSDLVLMKPSNFATKSTKPPRHPSATEGACRLDPEAERALKRYEFLGKDESSRPGNTFYLLPALYNQFFIP